MENNMFFPQMGGEEKILEKKSEGEERVRTVIENATKDFESRIAELEQEKEKKLSKREKLDLLREQFGEYSFPYVKLRESLLEPDDYADIPSLGDPSFRISWYDFDEDTTGEYVFLYRGSDGGVLPGTENLSSRASEGVSAEEILSKLKIDKTSIIVASSSLTGAFGSDPVLHTTRDKNIAIGFADHRGDVITYKIPKKWLTENKDDAAVTHVTEKEISIFHSLPKEFVEKVEHLSS